MINMIMSRKYPKAIAVITQEREDKEAALAKLSLRHARRCMRPESREQTPTTPANNANNNIKLVDGFPPKSVIYTPKTEERKHKTPTH